MYSNAIEEESRHLEVNSIYSPSMPTLNVSPKPIFNPSLILMILLMLYPKSHNDPRTSLRQQTVGVTKTTKMTKKSYNNAWNILIIV